MRPFRTVDVSTQEWRWVAFWGGMLVTLTLVPYAWAMFASNDHWHFLGILANPQDGATYFAKIRQGVQGNWLFDLRYTPEAHDPAGLFSFYLLLGHVARLLGFSTVIIFHLARIATSLFMFTALYQLGAQVWQRQRPRRLFFALTAIASGLGWLAIVIISVDGDLPPDLSVPEAFPLYAAYANPHFPLSIGLLALLASVLLEVYRPGFKEGPNADNGGLAIIIYSVILAIIQPPALVGIGGALATFILTHVYIKREIPWHEIRWGAMVWLPAFPVAVYYFLIFETNDMMNLFNQQNVTPTPNILLTLIGYGMLFVIAVPGIARAVRLFDRDGDQFMLMWLVVNFIALYIPYTLQRRFYIGLIIPIAYFAVRALEDYWFDKLEGRWMRVALILGFVLMLPSNVIALGIPLFGAVANQEEGADAGILVAKDYVEVYDWLNDFGTEGEVVLAAPQISLWIPARTDLRVVYGHPFETIPAEEREEQVIDFFSGRDCETLLTVSDNELNFTVSYVIWGPEERDIVSEAREDAPDDAFEDCIAYLESDSGPLTSEEQIKHFGDGNITLYTLRELR